MECIFCKIINNELPSYTIYEDEIVKVFLNIKPSSDGHLLIVPKKHYTNLEDIDLETLNHVNIVSKEMYKLLKDKLGVDGLTLCQNNDYGQEIKHYHLHLTPRYKNDNVSIVYPKEKRDIKDIYEILKDNIE
jgi:histidine triad (HIT) family protein